MKNSFRKLIPVAAALGFAFAASSAHAAITPFTLKDGSGNVLSTNTSSLDWSSTGSGVAIGAGPFSDSTLLPKNASFNFLYQSNLANVVGNKTGNYKLDSTSDGAADAGSAFEFTIVAKLTEYVKSSTYSDPDAKTDPTANFGLGAGDNKVAIYFDTARNSNTATGTGFDDGKLVALLTIVPDGTTSNFTAFTGTSTGQGSARMHATVSSAGDFIDQNYLQGVSQLLFGVNFQGTLNFPAEDSLTSAFHVGGSSLFPNYTVNPKSDIVFKVDGSNTFQGRAVPEPGTMMLLGMGMLGLVGAKRRRAPKA
jgi:hypothetical protein